MSFGGEMKSRTMSWAARLVLSFIGLSLLLAFQNCGKGFEMKEDLDLASVGTDLQTDTELPGIPLIQILQASDIINTANYTLTFNVLGVEAAKLESVTCELIGKSKQSCVQGSVTFASLADGDYQVKISVATLAGLKAETLKVFRKDATAPQVSLSAQPSMVTNQQTAMLSFTVSDLLAGVDVVECALNAAAFAACESPVNLNNLSSTAHQFHIRAKDKAGNVSPVVTSAWTVDLTAPTVLITKSPMALTKVRDSAFEFSGSNIVSYECSLDNQTSYQTCTSPVTYPSLVMGSHTFRVRGKNAAGTFSAPATFAWTIDFTPPSNPEVLSNITNPTKTTSISLTFSASDVGSTVASYKCKIDTGSWVDNCPSPQNYSSLATGSHTFSVQAIDQAGNVSNTVDYSWSVDFTGPTIDLQVKPALLSFSPEATFGFSINDNHSGAEIVRCSWKSLSAVSPTTDCKRTANVTYSALEPGNYVFTVEAVDRAGNSTILTYAWDVDSNQGTPQKYRSISAGNSGGCGITMTGGVQCWGGGGVGQLGNGEIKNSAIPVDVIGLTGVKALAKGVTGRQCVVTDQNAVKCWGINFSNSLGTGDPGIYLATPKDVIGLGPVKSVTNGGYHGCAIMPDDHVKCWGRNDLYQLGNNTNSDSPTPIEISSLGAVKSLALSVYFSCAATSDRRVLCWGRSDFRVPTEFPSLAGAILVFTDGDRVCAQDSALNLRCVDSYSGPNTPAELQPQLAGLKDLSISGNGACGLTIDQRVLCSSWNSSAPALERKTLAGTKALVGDPWMTCALTAEDYVRCWGTGTFGFNTITEAVVPLPVNRLAGAKKITSSFGDQACALTATDDVECWGGNSFGELGISGGGDSASMIPVKVPNVSNAKDVAAGFLFSCAINSADKVLCWGLWDLENQSFDSYSAKEVPGASDARSIAAGYMHACAVTNQGKLKCWGQNSNGQLGTGDKVASAVAVEVPGLSGVTGVALGNAHTCAIYSGGRVACWGANTFGSLGVNTVVDSLSPIEIPGLTGAMSISSMVNHTCAVMNTGGLKCWGFNDSGQIGDGTRYDARVPFDVPLTGVVSVAVSGQGRTCALTNQDRVFCWGDNGRGMFGNGTSLGTYTPVAAFTNTAAKAIYGVSDMATYVKRADGSIVIAGSQYLLFKGIAGPVKRP
jgi:alpha-tubulin suppressor-like RCC1 family protein